MRWQGWAQRLALAPLLALVVLLTGCALAPTPTSAPGLRAEQSAWNGRLALQIEEQAGQTAQSFSAAFELQGTAAQGDLTLISPLGNVLARLDWTPGHARRHAHRAELRARRAPAGDRGHRSRAELSGRALQAAGDGDRFAALHLAADAGSCAADLR